MRISFVVPTRDNARTIVACVASLRQQTHPDVEVVVVDNGSRDRTTELAAPHADAVVQHGPERCAQRNEGARRSTGDVVVFVDSDMVLEPGTAVALDELFSREQRTGAAVLPERAFGEGFWASCRAWEKELYVGDDQVESPRAFRREVFEAVGGWDETLTAAEDWDLTDRCRAAGVRVGRVDSWVWHDEGRLRLRGSFGKKRYYGRWLADYLDRPTASHRQVARSSLLAQPRLLRRPLVTTGLAVLKSVEVSGFLAGMHDARRARSRDAAA